MLARANGLQERLVTDLQEQAHGRRAHRPGQPPLVRRALEAALIRPVGAGTALVLIDVDSFKTINDTHGHPVGDAVLVHLAEVLREQVRADDAVLSRLGGDELAVLLRDCTPDVAAAAGRGPARTPSAPTPLPLHRRDPAVAVDQPRRRPRPERNGDLTALYHEADVALYDAKRAGRGRVAVAAA